MADAFNVLDFVPLQDEIDALEASVAAAAAVTALTNSTGQTPDNTIENVPAATAAPVDTNAASLTSTNAALTALEKNVADLAGKLNAVIAALA